MELKQYTNNILNQINDLVVLLDDKEIALPLNILSNSSIGMHMRHVIEFFECVILNSNAKILDYDNRLRNKALETSGNAIIKQIHFLQLSLINFEDANKELSATFINNNFIVNTCNFRELIYAIEHAVHHMAIIKIGVKNNFKNISLPENFGVADSTIAYNKTKDLITA